MKRRWIQVNVATVLRLSNVEAIVWSGNSIQIQMQSGEKHAVHVRYYQAALFAILGADSPWKIPPPTKIAAIRKPRNN